MDGKCNAGMFFFPANLIGDEQRMVIESRLKEETDLIWLIDDFYWKGKKQRKSLQLNQQLCVNYLLGAESW